MPGVRGEALLPPFQFIDERALIFRQALRGPAVLFRCIDGEFRHHSSHLWNV